MKDGASLSNTIYFDHASTCGNKPVEVSQEITRYLRDIAASPGRGGYDLQEEAYSLVEGVRGRLAKMLKAKRKEQVAFTYNATHAINIVLKGLLREGDHVVISNFEHNAVLRPIQHLTEERQVTYSVWESDAWGHLPLETLPNLVTPKTKLIVLNAASNVLGITGPVKAMAAFARSRKIPLLLDISQTAGLFDTNFGDICDYMAGTAHKNLMGPSGVGFLYVKDSETLTTLYEGGSGRNSLSPYQPETIPDKFEAGTINYLGIAGLKGSLDYIDRIGIETIRKRVMTLTAYAINKLANTPGVILYGPTSTDHKVPVLSFNMDGFFSSEVGLYLQQNGICVRTGLHCSPLIHKTIGTAPQGSVRLSLGHLNTESEIDFLCEVLKKINCEKLAQRNEQCTS